MLPLLTLLLLNDTSAECGLCHPAEFARWSLSRHAQSASNTIYKVSAAHFSRQWCSDCHAPTGVASEGIGCTSCHLQNGRVLTSNEPSAQAERAHPMQEDPAFAESAFCAGCHEFNFPVWSSLDGDHVIYTSEPMQHTYGEWRRTRSEQHCQECHMRAHAFPGAHDEAFVREAIGIQVKLQTPTRAVATLRALGVAHRLPTGDPFRRLVLRVCADAACRKEVGRAVAQRTFRSNQLVEDTSIIGERTFNIALSERLTGGGYYVLDYFFSDAKLESQLIVRDVSFEISRGRFGD